MVFYLKKCLFLAILEQFVSRDGFELIEISVYRSMTMMQRF